MPTVPIPKVLFTVRVLLVILVMELYVKVRLQGHLSVRPLLGVCYDACRLSTLWSIDIVVVFAIWPLTPIFVLFALSVKGK